jgi:hypothetical protein
VRIALIVEGKTEKAFLPYLKEFLKPRLEGNLPGIDAFPYYGRIPTEGKLRRVVQNLLNASNPADHVIALTDVYTGNYPPDFSDASDAKNKMRQWVGNEPRFHPHAAQHDFEAWLLPYWETIQKLARHNRNAPTGNPELVNHHNPPSNRIKEIFEIGKCRDSYIKPRDAARILRENNLMTSILQCSELKSLVNTILLVSGGIIIP